MPIDFNQLGATNLIDTATEPTTLFSALPRQMGGYTYLRNVQAEVLQGWYARRLERDIVLKMNTGAGKTVVGLLLLKSCLNEHAGPAAYITPDKYLANQVEKEARILGIEVTRDIDPRYLSGKAILVHNISKLINGRSKFGVDENTPLGSIVIDDVHSCLKIGEDKFTLTLPSQHGAYRELFSLFRGALEQQSMPRVLDIETGDPTKIMVVPYWSWRERERDVARILHNYRTTTEMEWEWPLVKDALANCTCIIGGQGLSISSRCLNISLVRDFHNAKRRIFMTATLADDSVLVTHLQADPQSIAKPVTPSSASDLGDRMILAPQELNPTITEDDIKKLLGWAARNLNVVVIVPSSRRAQYWGDLAAQTLNSENLAQGVDRMRAGLVGLTVLVNKYDGIDLPYDACRILVIDGLPEIDRWLDKVDGSVLEDSDIMLAKHVQRIEQGMGRGIRSNDDHCVVLLLGSRLIRRISLPDAQVKFTPATWAQLELSRNVATQLQGKTLREIYTDAMALCLNRDPRWVQVSRAAVAGVGYAPRIQTTPRAVHQRTAFDAALLGRYPAAVSAMETAIMAETDNRVQGWLKQQMADYMHPSDPVQAQHIQLSAQKLNRLVLKPVQGVDYVRLNLTTRTQAEALSLFLTSAYKNTTTMLLAYNAILEELVFQPESFQRFEAAIQGIGEHLGFAAHRPEIQFGKGPDNLWALGGQRFVMIECKNEATTNMISKHYINQSSGGRHWFTQMYGPGCTAESVIVHPSKIVSRQASPEPALRILTSTKLDEFKSACHTLANGIAQLPSFGDVQGIAKALNHLELTAEKLVLRFTEEFVMEKAA